LLNVKNNGIAGTLKPAASLPDPPHP